MTIEKKALLGFHNTDNLDRYGRMLERKGFMIDETEFPDEMLKKARESSYDFYLMDVNLGVAGGEDITVARQVYDLVRERVEKGEAKFLALSYSWEPIEKAKSEGIPAIEKRDFYDYFANL